MEKRIRIVDGIDTKELFGNMDINMKLVKEATGVDVVQRGDELVLIAESDLPDMDLTGMDMSEMKEADQEESIDLAERIIAEFISLLKSGENIDRQRAAYIVNLSREGVSYQENSVGKDVICFTHSGKPLKPKTLGQKNYVQAIRDKEVVFGIGPAGTGKTYIAVAMAVNALKAKQVNKIILARPAVEAGERLGFLPGDLQDKRRGAETQREGSYRGRASRVHERPHSRQRFHNTGRGAERDQGADEDVPHQNGLRIPRSGHGRRNADRPSERQKIRPGGSRESAETGEGHRLLLSEGHGRRAS